VWVVRLTGRRGYVIGTVASRPPEGGCGSRARRVQRRQLTLIARAAPCFGVRWVARGARGLPTVIVTRLLNRSSSGCLKPSSSECHAGGTARQRIKLAGRRTRSDGCAEPRLDLPPVTGETVSLARRLSGGLLDWRRLVVGLRCEAGCSTPFLPTKYVRQMVHGERSGAAPATGSFGCSPGWRMEAK
jgi:hypothetical protein